MCSAVCSEERCGITVAGNIITDSVKTIDSYPKIGMLSNISDVALSVGGCVPNTGIDLKRIDGDLAVSAIGKIGNDANGRFVLDKLKNIGINCDAISVSDNKPTSFCDVMSVSGGERTFFHAKGANAEFSAEDIDVEKLSCKIFHIGYILLLDCFDKADSEYGTAMARLLSEVRKRGIKTSIDVVSSSADEYKEKIIPALKYCSYAIMNEVEGCMVSGLEPYNSDGSINTESIRLTMKAIADCGVSEKVIIHCKKAGFCYDVKSGEFTSQPAVDIPREWIKGSVGAGDAFCAGALYSLYHGYSDKKLLSFAAGVAACSLMQENSVDGVKSREETEKLIDTYGGLSL